MAVRTAYSNLPYLWRMNRIPIRYLTLLILLYILFPPVKLHGQSEYDEISVFLEVPLVGGGEIAAVIKGQDLYLPVTDLFDFLKSEIFLHPDWNLYPDFLSILKLHSPSVRREIISNTRTKYLISTPGT